MKLLNRRNSQILQGILSAICIYGISILNPENLFITTMILLWTNIILHGITLKINESVVENEKKDIYYEMGSKYIISIMFSTIVIGYWVSGIFKIIPETTINKITEKNIVNKTLESVLILCMLINTIFLSPFLIEREVKRDDRRNGDNSR